ncbi:hypothetical protein SAMN04488134_101399 [Amphibacillus marinus]|uniref:Coupling factor for flagellin transcription and translation n=1 Tax=Amphibacillus marinus TaxID=872970 RepID=A0A1H8HP39_9BACI|nr:hypothetical protein [Amphibacillus marinus]SEN57755.1 hypothetical protein SAMN04488134_101399 [Amphibacillus marinus]
MLLLYILLLISFFLHVLTFVQLRQMKVKHEQPRRDHEHLIRQQKELEELLSVYLVEMREENESLLAALTKKTPKKANVIEQDRQEQDSKDDPDHGLKTKYSDYKPLADDKPGESFKPSLAAQVLAMHDQGQAVDAIAKQLNKGRTEIELMLKFQQKND